MKKLLVICLVGILAFSVGACGGGQGSSGDAAKGSVVSEVQETSSSTE